MQIITSREEAENMFYALRYEHGKSIGFVPTMGSLHDGHLSLIERAKEENDCVVASVFVNPTQFNNSEDFDKYPRDNKKDIELLASVDCDYLFLPEAKDMYPNPISTSIAFGELETLMEGAFREGHFNGVGQVLSKLFHLVPANKSYFGQKDLQQYLIVKQLVRDLFFQTEIVLCPIKREKNGLAMSSRNERLSSEARQKAAVLHKALLACKSSLEEGHSLKNSIDAGKKLVETETDFELEYFEVVDALTLKLADESSKSELAICLAAFIENVRLIDNMIVTID